LAFEEDAVAGDVVSFADRPVGSRAAAADQSRAGGAIGAVVVGVGHLEGRMAVVAVGAIGGGGAGADDRAGAALIHAEGPLRDVVVVSAPVGHLAAGIFIPPAELVMAAFGDVFDVGGR